MGYSTGGKKGSTDWADFPGWLGPGDSEKSRFWGLGEWFGSLLCGILKEMNITNLHLAIMSDTKIDKEEVE